MKSRRNTTLKVVLIGSKEDKIAFLQMCGVENPQLKFSNSFSGEQVTFHRGIKTVVKLYMYDDIEHCSIPFEISYSPVYVIAADAFIYLNRTCEEKKEFELIRNKATCVAYDYQSIDFKDALNCLENIASPNHDEFYDRKLSLFLCAHAFDIGFLPNIMFIPKEINDMICSLYSMVCSNRNIFSFFPKINITPVALITFLNKEEKEKLESDLIKNQEESKNACCIQ